MSSAAAASCTTSHAARCAEGQWRRNNSSTASAEPPCAARTSAASLRRLSGRPMRTLAATASCTGSSSVDIASLTPGEADVRRGQADHCQGESRAARALTTTTRALEVHVGSRARVGRRAVYELGGRRVLGDVAHRLVDRDLRCRPAPRRATRQHVSELGRRGRIEAGELWAARGRRLERPARLHEQVPRARERRVELPARAARSPPT